jgi:HEAT repeat protein
MDEVIRQLNGLTEALLSGDDQAAEAAAKNIAGQGQAGLAALEPLLTDPDPERRWWGVRAVAEIKGSRSVSLLIQALDDPDQAVRGCAARGLQEQPDERAVPALTAALDDCDTLVARLAGNALVAAGEVAVPALLDVLQEGTDKPRLEAARALAQIGDQRSIPALFEALDSDSPLVEYWANMGLERMGVGMAFFIP